MLIGRNGCRAMVTQGLLETKWPFPLLERLQLCNVAWWLILVKFIKGQDTLYFAENLTHALVELNVAGNNHN